MEKFRKIALICLVLLISGCDKTIHEYPEPQKSLVIIQPNVCRETPKYYKSVVYDDNWNSTVSDLPETRAMEFLADDNYHLHVIVDVYSGKINARDRSGKRVCRRTFCTDHDAMPPHDTLHFNLYDDDYYILAWADYVPKSDKDNSPYDTDTLTAVRSLIHDYPDNTYLRSSASGNASFSIDYGLTSQGYPSQGPVVIDSRIIPLELERPEGRYRIEALDYDEFLASGGKIEDLTIKVIYKQYVSVGFNVASDEPNDFIQAYSFDVKPASFHYDEDNSSSLFTDYVFTSPDRETNVIFDMYIYDAEGNEINHCQNIKVPLSRDRETVVKGYFLTVPLGDGDDISIDDSFEGEYEIDLDL